MIYDFSKVFTRDVPFPEIPNPWALVPRIKDNIHPDQPTQTTCYGTVVSDDMWKLIRRCWASDLTARPDINEIIHLLDGMIIDYFPPSLYINEVHVQDNGAIVANGRYAEVSRGVYQGQDVAIKRFHIYVSDDGEDVKLYKVRLYVLSSAHFDVLPAFLRGGPQVASIETPPNFDLLGH